MDRFPGGKYDSYDDEDNEESKAEEPSKLRAPIPLSEILGRSNAGSGNFLANLGLPKSEKKSSSEEDDDDDDEEEEGLFGSLGKGSRTPRPARLGGLGLGSFGAPRSRGEQTSDTQETPDIPQDTLDDTKPLSSAPEQVETTTEEPIAEREAVSEVNDAPLEPTREYNPVDTAEDQEVSPTEVIEETESDEDDANTAKVTPRATASPSSTSASGGGGGNINLPPPVPTPNPNLYPPTTPPVPPTPRPVMNPNTSPVTPNVLNTPNSATNTVIERTSYGGAVGAFLAAEISSRYRDRKIKREFRAADKKLGKKIEKLADQQLSQAEAQATLNEHQQAQISRLDRKVGTEQIKPALVTQLTEVQNKAEIITNLDIDQRAEARADVHATMPSVETLVKAENTYEHLIEEHYQQEAGHEQQVSINSFEALDNEGQRNAGRTPDILVPPPISYGGGQAQAYDGSSAPVGQPPQAPLSTPMPARIEPPSKGQYTQPIALGALAAVVVLVVVIMAYALAR